MHTDPGYSIIVNKTHVLSNGRSTTLEPCDSKLFIQEKTCQHGNGLCSEIFCTTANDETPGLSTEDRHFIELMNREFKPARRFTQMDPKGPKWRPKWTQMDPNGDPNGQILTLNDEI